METIEDLKEKLSLVIWVNRNLGKLCEYHVVNADGEEVLQMGRIVGYYLANNRVIVEIIEDRFIDRGWNYIEEGDNIILNCPDDATFLYAGLENLRLKPKEFELPATEMLDALEEITRNFAQCSKATASDLKEIKSCVSTLKSKIYGLK